MAKSVSRISTRDASSSASSIAAIGLDDMVFQATEQLDERPLHVELLDIAPVAGRADVTVRRSSERRGCL